MKKIKKKKPKSKPFIMRIDPRIDEAVDQALAMVDRGKIRAGEKIISELLKTHPDVHTVQYANGVICALRGRYGEAIVYFDKAIQIYPYFVEAWSNKGFAHQKRLEIEETIRAFQKVIEIGDPAEDFVRKAKDLIEGLEQQIRKDEGLSLNEYLHAMAKFNAGFAAMERREWEKALREFQQVVTMSPKKTQSYGNMGVCYAHLGQKEEALRALDKALELDPNYEPAIVNRAMVRTLKEGEKLPEIQYKSVDYYKDYPLEGKSLIRRIVGGLLLKGLLGKWWR